MVYNAKQRTGDVLHSEFCDSCRMQDQCTVTDTELKQWLLCGLGCMSWRPKKISADSNKNYQV